MPRNQPRKTTIGLHSAEEMQFAVNMVMKEKLKIRAVAKLRNIPYTTLQRYCKKVGNANDSPVRLTPNYEVNRIFNEEQEKALVEYIIKCSEMFYGLTTIEVRKLAYEMAKINQLKVPKKWDDTHFAGIDWLYCFRRRHNCLSLRTPEGCSLSRATSFNRHNVNIFYDNLHDVMSREASFGNGTRVYNLDESNTMTVQKSAKVLATKGQKQVSKVTSAEKGTLVTTCCIVSALGHALPPVMIFPRVHFKQHMTVSAPTGTLGLATPSGWMNSDLFVKTLQHFIDYTHSTKENPTLLIMDNFEAHISLRAVTLAKDNGVSILTVPPHSTGKLQPLDVAVFKPFKVFYNAAVDSWMMRNPGKTFSIYQVAECVNEAHMKAMTPQNIISAFKATGIFPYNRNLFTDADFAPSEVTDRRENEENIPPATVATMSIEPQAPAVESTRCPSPPSKQPMVPSSSVELPNNPPTFVAPPRTPPPCAKQTMAFSPSAGPSNDFTSPLQFRGLPKAGPRKVGRVPRRKGKSMIATDTPNKDEIEKREGEKRRIQIKKSIVVKKRVFLSSDSSNEGNDINITEGSLEEEPEGRLVIPENLTSITSLPEEGSFVLVQFTAHNKKIYYVGKVLQIKETEVEVSFLRKSINSSNKFRVPNVADISYIALNDIKLILRPKFSGTTKRQEGFYSFDANFSKIDIR